MSPYGVLGLLLLVVVLVVIFRLLFGKRADLLSGKTFDGPAYREGGTVGFTGPVDEGDDRGRYGLQPRKSDIPYEGLDPDPYATIASAAAARKSASSSPGDGS
jgi:hypothetical protein